jgi:predicted ATPase/class 3 adenylate cyclase
MAFPRGIPTFLFTDIEDSTRLWDEHPRMMKTSLAEHDEILRNSITANDGRIVKTMGDGFFAVFATATEAILAVLQCQRRLHAEQWPGPGPIRVRMALHSGEAQIRDDDYYGTPVNRAARLMSLAAGGQVLLSAVTVSLARSGLPESISFLDLGWHQLRGLNRPEHVYQLAHPDLPLNFPPLISLGSSPNNLPEQPTSFIGREREVEEIINLLNSSSRENKNVRLLTLTGPGGTGKTRLSLEVARRSLSHYPDGVYFVGLAAITEASQVPNAIAVELGLVEQPGLPLSELLARFFRKKEMLLVLDNFEQVINAASLVNHLLSVAPRLTILVTSREILSLSGEREYMVQPLTMPAYPGVPFSKLASFEAISLFIQRARAAAPKFMLTEENAGAVVAICAHLDALPLAIELAAARIRLFSPQQILQRLENRLDLLKSNLRDLPARQRTLRSTIDWSFNLLNENEQRLFSRLAVFLDGRTIEAVQIVCAPGLEIDVPDGLESLLNKSLLFKQDGPGGEPRFFMLELIHEYAHERLAESGELHELQERHLRYYCSLAEEMEPGYRQQDQLLLFNLTEAEWSNLQLAFNWALDNRHYEEAARLISSLDYFLRFKERLVEGYRWITRMLADVERIPENKLARFYLAAARISFVFLDPLEGEQFANKTVKFARIAGDERSEAFALLSLGVYASLRGDFSEALTRCQAGKKIFQTLSDKSGLAETYNVQGEIAKVAGDLPAARKAYEKSLEFCRETGEVLRVYMILSNMSHIAYIDGDFQQSQDFAFKSLSGWLEIGVRQGIISALWTLAGPTDRLGESQKAARLLGASQALFHEMGAADHPSDLPQLALYMNAVQEQLGQQAFDEAWEAGQAMTLEQAVTYALKG